MGIYFPISVVHIQGRKSEGNGWGQAEEPHEGQARVWSSFLGQSRWGWEQGVSCTSVRAMQGPN